MSFKEDKPNYFRRMSKSANVDFDESELAIVDNVEFVNKKFVISGEFLSIDRATLKVSIEEKGGKVTTNLSGSTILGWVKNPAGLN